MCKWVYVDGGNCPQTMAHVWKRLERCSREPCPNIPKYFTYGDENVFFNPDNIWRTSNVNADHYILSANEVEDTEDPFHEEMIGRLVWERLRASNKCPMCTGAEIGVEINNYPPRADVEDMVASLHQREFGSGSNGAGSNGAHYFQSSLSSPLLLLSFSSLIFFSTLLF
jgi:hypothetical protein